MYRCWKKQGFVIKVLLKGLGIGQQKAWLKKEIELTESINQQKKEIPRVHAFEYESQSIKYYT